ncbi:MAG: hypothetical protein IT379_35955, partial [Deltaproteobacteria bacterium]|nr:hypothetical protein [Deltaproteobacteria bacterium]
SRDGDLVEARGEMDLWVSRVSREGQLLGTRSWGGSGYDIVGLGAASVELPDGDVLMVGETRSRDGDAIGNHGDYDAFVVRTRRETPDPGPRVGQSGLVLPGGRRGAVARVARPPHTAEGAAGGEPSPPPETERNEPDDAPSVLAFSRTFGGSAADRPLDSPQALIRTRAGGFAFVATTESSDGDLRSAVHGRATVRRGEDVWVGVTDSEGRLLRSTTLGGSGSDVGAALAEAPDGDLVVVATTRSNDGDVSGNHGMTDVWAARLRSSGELVWSRTLGGSSAEHAASIAATRDGGFVIGASTCSDDGDVRGRRCAYDQWVVRIDGDGDVLWSRTYGGSSNEWLIQIVETRDGGFAAIGRTESDDGDVSDNHGTYDYWVIRLGRTGALRWARTYGSWDWEWGNSIAELPDGGFVLGGYTYTSEHFDGDVTTSHGEFDYWVLRIDRAGEIEWQRSFGGGNYELGYGIVPLRSGGFAMIGGSPSADGQVAGNHGDWDAWLVRMADDGSLLAAHALGGSGYDAGYAIVEDALGRLVVLGETYSDDGDVRGLHGDEDVWLVAIDAPPRASM